MYDSIPGEVNVLDGRHPRGVHEDVGHRCKTDLSATFSCRRLPEVPRYSAFSLETADSAQYEEKVAHTDWNGRLATDILL